MSRFDVDALEGQTFGLDPLLFLGLATVGCGALGWVIGPFAGNVVFNTIYRRQWRQISEVDRFPLSLSLSLSLCLSVNLGMAI